jgi:hypothetical protein
MCNFNSSQLAHNDEPTFLLGVNILTQELKLKYHVKVKSYLPKWIKHHILQGVKEGNNKL